ncbi:MAG: SDR family oxidoreductase, partial [Kovacikia sp.]
ALEGAPHGVTCNTISPGWVETDFGKKWMQTIAEASGQSLRDYMQSVQQSNPQQRIIQPEEIGALAAFLCSDAAIGITMQDITVSGGSLW